MGIIGCGVVASRHYVPALRSVARKARVVACADISIEAARRVAAECADFSPGAVPYAEPDGLLRHEGLDAVFDLTPATIHGPINRAALAAGVHVFSEKPIASTVEEADELIALAKERGRMLQCAPGVMAAPWARWVGDIIASGRLGHVTFATAQFGALGAAGGRGYPGDPTVFYSKDIGPLVDQGIYLLHAVTGLLGPVRRLQAMGRRAMPRRVSVAPGSIGKEIDVECDDVMLANLDLGERGVAALTSSYAAPKSNTPQLEIQLSEGSISVPNIFTDVGPLNVWVRDPTPLGLEGWLRDVTPPYAKRTLGVIPGGGAHFIRCLADGEAPVLSAEHARHALEIMLAMRRSAETGEAQCLRTVVE